MYRSTLLLAASSLVAGSVIQKPLHESPRPLHERSTSVQALLGDDLPLVSSEAIQADITKENLLARAEKLFTIAEEGIAEYNHPTRVIGSQGHISTVDYIYSTIASLGDYYEITNQSFPAVVGNIFESRLVLNGTVPATASPMSLTPPTKNKDSVFGPLVLVSNLGCDASDYPAAVNGSIAVISRGTCSFGTKSSLAGAAGAVAAVIYNNANGSLSGTLGDPSDTHVATFGISDTEAAPYVASLKNGTALDGSAYIDAVVENINTTNIIAQTTQGNASSCVMLGGHSDSVAEGPGINDDGTGTNSLLEIATQLTKYSVNNCVRFAWWAAEEEGLLGSDYYVSQLTTEENMKIRMFMDYDMLASPNFAYQVYNATNAVNPVGSEQLRDLYTAYYEDHGLNYTYIAFDGRSDYDAFIQNGIPGGGIATGAEGVKTVEEAAMFGGTAGDWFDPCYHQLCDNVTNLALDAWVINTQLVAHSVATYAVSLEGFPERTLSNSSSFKALANVKSSSSSAAYHGPELIL